jgi:hypothetical protein
MGKRLDAKFAGILVFQLRRQLEQHADVVARPEARDRKDRLDLRVLEGVAGLTGPVGWVQVDEDGPDTRRCELQQQPFDVVRRPHADAVPTPETEPQQAGRQRVAFARELGVGEAPTLVECDHGFAFAEAFHHAPKVLRDGVAEQRLVASPVVVAARQVAHSTASQ